ncbi:LysM peptidoglycan-binding domain-containing protein [Microbacterium sp. NPDC076911]|uniref:LysM peptidoglycan-binding domain-containing protein n=1 Tax=Microbacterium sp. NPDC076911 TaxID=3154958 RepID=UPI003448203D
MTTIGITAFSPAASLSAQRTSSQSTKLRLTARGRRVFAAIAALPLVIALSIAAISGGAAMASRDSGVASVSYETVTVGSGDSLWSIAEEVAPAADPRDVVDAIVRLNALDSANVLVGQRLAVPAEYSSGS